MTSAIEGVIKKQNKALKIFEKVRADLSDVVDAINDARGDCGQRILDAERAISTARNEEETLQSMAAVNARRIEKINELLEG